MVLGSSRPKKGSFINKLFLEPRGNKVVGRRSSWTWVSPPNRHFYSKGLSCHPPQGLFIAPAKRALRKTGTSDPRACLVSSTDVHVGDIRVTANPKDSFLSSRLGSEAASCLCYILPVVVMSAWKDSVGRLRWHRTPFLAGMCSVNGECLCRSRRRKHMTY
jgi:hypothetical protein